MCILLVLLRWLPGAQEPWLVFIPESLISSVSHSQFLDTNSSAGFGLPSSSTHSCRVGSNAQYCWGNTAHRKPWVRSLLHRALTVTRDM